MRRKLFIIPAVLIMAACARETAPEQSIQKRQAPKQGEEVQISVTLPPIDLVETRVSLSSGADGRLIPSWEATDVILVGDREFSCTAVNGQSASFSGIAPAGNTFDISYPVSASSEDVLQKADNDFSHLRYKATLKGVDSYQDVVFSHGWASEHGGSFSQMGALQLVLNLPARASAISMVSFAPEDMEPISLAVDGVAPIDGKFTAWLPFPLEKIELSPAKTVTVAVTTEAGDFTNTFIPAPQTLYGGYVIKLVTSPAKWTHVLSGKGSEADPYLIATPEDFDNIRNLLSIGTQTWFKQTADIDLAAYTAWQPLNLENAAYGIGYDGNGFKIKNFRCTASKWASIFGVLHGEVKNLTVEDSEVVTTGTNPCGTVAAWAGNIDGSLQARLINVKVVRGKVSNNDNDIFGGMVGRACASSFTDCSFDGIVERTGSKDYTTTYYPVGGLIGQALDGVSITGCSTSGSITTAYGRATGGILGQCNVTLNIADCSSTMTVTACDDVVGGIVGYYGGGSISNCHVEADITVQQVRATSSAASYIGGIAGHSSATPVVTDCSFKGTLTGASGIIGGILGQSNSSTGEGCVISRCYSSGAISGNSVLGGIIGRATNQGLSMTDCGSSMDVTGKGAYVGGIMGDAPQNSTVSRCFATGTIMGSFALGGIIGRAFGRQGSTASLDTDVNITVEDCIAFNAAVRTLTSGGETPNNHYSGGAVIGCSSRPNTLRNCWRSADFVLDFYADASLNLLFDHSDSSPQSPLAQPAGSAKWFSPYHGKAAASGATVSSVAQTLGWSTTVWNLSGSVPVLK